MCSLIISFISIMKLMNFSFDMYIYLLKFAAIKIAVIHDIEEQSIMRINL